MDKKKVLAKFNRFIAIALIVLGFLGILLPILPGWPFIFIGLFLLGGTELIDKKILRYLPEKHRTKVKSWISRNENQQKSD